MGDSGLTKTEVARRRNVSVQAVYGWIRRGCPVSDDGKLNLADVDAFLADRDAKASAPGSLEAERARLAKEQADQCAMKNAQLRGELIPADAVEGAWGDMVASFRAKMLSLPGKAAPQVVALNSIPEVKSLLEKIVYEALDELANPDYRDGADADTGDDPPDAPIGEVPAPADRKRLGRPKSKAVPGKQRGTGRVDHRKG